MKYYLTLLRRNPTEVLRKIISIVKEKAIGKFDNSKKVIIYSLGKAGTSSVYEVLRYSRFVDVRHIHYLSYLVDDNISQWRKLEEKRAEEVKKWIENGDVLIISLVRDPFSRSLSSVIQNYELYHQNTDFSEAIVENAKTISLNWWDQEFLKSMNWDVYDYPFDKEKGCSKYSLGNNNELLIIKSTQISSVGLREIGKELNINLKPKRVNGSRNKRAAIQHRHILKDFKFQQSDFDLISKGKFMKHFYSDDEISELKDRWAL